MRVGWVTSASDLQAVTLLEAALALQGDTEIVGVCVCEAVADKNEHALNVEAVARKHAIPVGRVDVGRFRMHGVREDISRLGHEEWRAALESEIVSVLACLDVQVVVLAGYMLIAGPVLLEAYPMINLHPGLPGGPKGTRSQVIRTIISENPTAFGAMVHVVTPELDCGPPILVCSADLSEVLLTAGLSGVEEPGAFDVIERTILAMEPDLLKTALSQVSAGGLPPISNGRVVQWRAP